MASLKFLNPEKIKGIVNDQGTSQSVQSEIVEDPPKRKRGRPKKEATNQEIVVSDSTGTGNNVLPLCQSNEPYEDSYIETNNMLRHSITQIDILANDVKSEIDNVKKSKTLKGKYKYISDLCATASNLVSTKISAIKEINSATTKCHELEIRRQKDIKSAITNQQDDDKYISDLYNAYINTPVNAGQSPFLNYTSANTTNNMGILMNGQNIITGNEEQNYQAYLNNMTPEQNRMLIGDNPNIETVVVYDPNTGDKAFDVIDTRTGTPVTNYPRPDAILLDDTVIDFQSGIASNSNLGQNWKVVVLGDYINQY